MARKIGGLACALLAVFVYGCGGGDESDAKDCKVDTSYDPAIDPANFVADVTNPLFPLVVSTKFTYKSDVEDIVVSVEPGKKEILGVPCTIVHDVASVSGETIEDTFDWYAQAKDGAVWYFGEDTKEMKNGKVISTEGSWEGGVENAKPGTLIPAKPTVGVEYRQEYAACDAEDMGSVLALSESTTAGGKTFDNCLKTHDFTPLEPDANEEKYYCPNTGLVLSVDVTTGEREELISVTGP